MSYTVTCYQVDIDALKKLCGSKDSNALKTILKKQIERIEDTNDSFADEIEEEGAPGLDAAITQLIMNEEMNPEFGFMYGYALEALCAHLGQMMDMEAFESMTGGWFWELPDTIQSLVLSGSPVELPEIEDFPTIGHKTLTQINDELANQDEYEDDTDEGDAYKCYYDALTFCQNLKTGFVAFYY